MTRLFRARILGGTSFNPLVPRLHVNGDFHKRGLITTKDLSLTRTRPRRSKVSAGIAVTSGAFALMVAVNPQNAAADCFRDPKSNTVTCTGTTTTNDTIFPAPPTDRDRAYVFTTGGPVTGTVESGAIVNGFGLAIANFQPAKPATSADVKFTNAGTIMLTTGVPTVGAPAALELLSQNGNVTYSGNGNVSSGGFNANAVDLFAAGNVSFGTSAAPITGTFGGLNGVLAEAGGNVGIFLLGGSVTATGSEGDPIFASAGGNVIIQTTNQTTIAGQPGSIGIFAVSGGNVTVTTDANIGTSAARLFEGIEADADGAVTVVTGGTVNASTGISASAFGDIFVGNSGIVNATGAAIFAETSGNVVVSNSGLLTGAMSLFGATNTFNNNGTWNATGNSSFAGPSIVNNNGNGVINISGPAGITLGATSTFNNSGTINASSSPAGSPTITAANFNNSGLINLATGTATNQLTLFGNFTGLRGSTLGISVNSSSGSADQLIIKGTASGTTSVFANYLGPLKFVTTPIPVVTASPVSTATFSLLDPNNGPLMYSLNQSGGLYSLVSSGLSPTGTFIATATPAAVAATQLTITGIETQLRQRRDQIQCYSSSGITSACNAAHAMSYQDVVSSYQQENTKQDPATNAIAMAVKAPAAPPAVQDLGPKPGVWVQAFDDWQRLDQSIASENAGTKQNTYGFQGGFDETWRNLLGSGDALVLGLVGGYTQASVHYDAGTTKATLSGPGFGGYWTYINGGFSTDGVVKNDWFHLTDDVFQTVFQTGQSSSANVQNFSVTGNAQYKFAVLTNSFIEPTAGFVYTQTSYSDVPATLDTLVNGHTTRVQGGARFGTAWDYNGIHFEPTLLGLVYDNVQVTGTPLQSIGVVVPTDEGKVRGEFDGVLNADFGKGFSGFAEGDVRFGDNLLGGTVKVGLRKQW